MVLTFPKCDEVCGWLVQRKYEHGQGATFSRLIYPLLLLVLAMILILVMAMALVLVVQSAPVPLV